jgi:hypothetical protein
LEADDAMGEFNRFHKCAVRSVIEENKEWSKGRGIALCNSSDEPLQAAHMDEWTVGDCERTFEVGRAVDRNTRTRADKNCPVGGERGPKNI